MTPGARLSAAMTLLDRIFAGDPAERALTRWARASRFAGSKDRAAVRDLVYDALRRRRSLGWLGGADTGRAILMARTALDGHAALDTVFTGERYDPPPPTEAERARLGQDLAAAPRAVRLDVPDFLMSELEAGLGDDFEPVMRLMQQRAPLDLRVNTLVTTPDAATVVLARDGVQTRPLPMVSAALRVEENPRLVAASRAYTQGMVELQDVSSQRVAELAGAQPGLRVLDYCAGGGGKALAMAAAMANEGHLMAFDASPERMRDLPVRARRARARIETLSAEDLASLGAACDLVLVDAPCSGTGAWRRKPDQKWRLTPEQLSAYRAQQDAILDVAAGHVRPGGRLVYATCSLLSSENEDRVAAFLQRHPFWQTQFSERLTPLDGGDGFFVATLSAPDHG